MHISVASCPEAKNLEAGEDWSRLHSNNNYSLMHILMPCFFQIPRNWSIKLDCIENVPKAGKLLKKCF